MNANQKPNRYQNTSHQTLLADKTKDVTAHDLSMNKNLLSLSGLEMPATDRMQTLGAFDWKHTINETYFDLDVSFRQPNKFSGFLQHAKLLEIGVSHYHANTVHYNRGRQSSGYIDDSILITFPMTGDVRFTQKGRQLTSKPGQYCIDIDRPERGDDEYQLVHTIGTLKAHRVLRPSAPRKYCFNPSDGRCCLSYIGQILT